MRRAPGTLAILMAGVTVAPAWAQPAGVTVLVEGSPVALTRPPERVGGEWFLPLQPIARALGIVVAPAPDIAGVRARLPSGIDSVFDGRTGEIRQGQVLMGSVRQYRQVVLQGPIDTVLFPIAGLVALLSVDVEEDPAGRTLRIHRAGPGTPATPPTFTLAGLDYALGVTAGEGEIGHFTSARGEAIAGSVPVSSAWLLSGSGSALAVRQAFAEADFGAGWRLGLGDQAAWTSIAALSAAYRGVGVRAPLGGFDTEVFAGRAVGSTRASLGVPGLATYDSNIAGLGVRRTISDGDLSLSAQRFDGSERSGSSAGAAYVHVAPRNQFKGEVVVGRYSGRSPRPATVGEPSTLAGPLSLPDPASSNEGAPARRLVDGAAIGLSVVNTFTPVPRLSLTTQAERYGENLLTAREDPQFHAQFSKRLTATVRPIDTMSLFAGVNERRLLPGPTAPLSHIDYGASIVVPGMPVLLGYLAARQEDAASPVSAMELRQLSATITQVGRYSGNAAYSETLINHELTRSLNGSVTLDAGRLGRISAAEQVQIRHARRLGVDWQREIPGVTGSVRAGLERLSDLRTGRSQLIPLGALDLGLPGRQHLNIAYSAEPGNRTLRLGLSGPVGRRPDIRRDGPRPLLEPDATVVGRVYFDADADGSFQDGNPDRGLGGVTVWLDGDRPAPTDRHGMFRFDGVKPGAHVLRAELEGIPADLAFTGVAERTFAVVAYGRSVQEFRVVRTGSVHARVLVLDEDEHGRLLERPLPEARVIASDTHDSYTDVNGSLMITALPPGLYELRVDAETVPEGYVATPQDAKVEVKPGQAVQGVRFVLAPAPKPILRRTLGSQEPVASPEPAPQR